MEENKDDSKQLIDSENQIGISTDSAQMSGQNVAGVMNLTNNYLGYNVEKEQGICCPKCNAEPENIEGTKVKCQSCGTIYFTTTPFNPKVSRYKNLREDNVQLYVDLLAKISNSIILGNYIDADIFCTQAIELSPATPQGWEYKAMCLYFIMDKGYLVKTKAKHLQKYLQVAKSHYENEVEVNEIGSYFNICENIANRMFNMLRNRIFWVRKNINENEIQRIEICNLILMMLICNDINPKSSIYLEALVNYFTGYDLEAWIDLEINEQSEKGYNLVDISPLEGKLFDLLYFTEKLIRNTKPDYSIKEYMVGGENDSPRPLDEYYQIKIKQKSEQSEADLFEIREKERLNNILKIYK